MRIKFPSKRNDSTGFSMDKLVFGTRYAATVFGGSFWFEFVHTRNNRVQVQEMNAKVKDGVVAHHVARTITISKAELKLCIKDGVFEYITTADSRPLKERAVCQKKNS